MKNAKEFNYDLGSRCLFFFILHTNPIGLLLPLGATKEGNDCKLQEKQNEADIIYEGIAGFIRILYHIMKRVLCSIFFGIQHEIRRKKREKPPDHGHSFSLGQNGGKFNVLDFWRAREGAQRCRHKKKLGKSKFDDFLHFREFLSWGFPPNL